MADALSYLAVEYASELFTSVEQRLVLAAIGELARGPFSPREAQMAASRVLHDARVALTVRTLDAVAHRVLQLAYDAASVGR